MMSSCNSQIDIEKLDSTTNIPQILKVIESQKKDTSLEYGLQCYTTKETNHFKFGDVSFSNYTVPDGYSSDYSLIYICVDNYDSNNYLGTELHLTNEEEGKQLLNYLKQKYGEPEMRTYEGRKEKKGEGVYFWDNDSENFITLIQKQSPLKTGGEFLDTRFVILKKDIELKPNIDSDPEVLQDILSKNPKAFNIVEIFKSNYPEIKNHE